MLSSFGPPKMTIQNTTMGLVRRCSKEQIRALVSRETKQPRKQIDSRSASYGGKLSNYAMDAKHFDLTTKLQCNHVSLHWLSGQLYLPLVSQNAAWNSQNHLLVFWSLWVLGMVNGDSGFGLTDHFVPRLREGSISYRVSLFPVSRLTTLRGGRHHCHCFVPACFSLSDHNPQSAHPRVSASAPPAPLHQSSCTARLERLRLLQAPTFLPIAQLFFAYHEPSHSFVVWAVHIISYFPTHLPQSHLSILHSTHLIDHN